MSRSSSSKNSRVYTTSSALLLLFFFCILRLYTIFRSDGSHGRLSNNYIRSSNVAEENYLHVLKLEAPNNSLISIVASNQQINDHKKLENIKGGDVFISTPSSTSNPNHMSSYNATEYEIQLQQSLKPLHNVSTCTYMHMFYAGFCNQYSMFISVIMMATEANHSQILLHGIAWKDTYGTNHRLRHDYFFDVVHWNAYYPRLPRFVTYDKTLHNEVTLENVDAIRPNLKWNIEYPYMNATKPYSIGTKNKRVAWVRFLQYTKQVEVGKRNRSDAELLMMKEAFKPHPEIQQIIDNFKSLHQMKDLLVLHARIEPDMQKHPVCKEYKVLNISDIVTMIYEKYEEPPVSTVLIVLNREILEQEADDTEIDNELATHNLKVLNELVSKGLWGGRVKVVEAGSALAKHSGHKLYSKYNSLVGSIINFFLAVEANIFIGTRVSSWSGTVINYRFYKEEKMNYFYQPKGLDWVTPPLVDHPPRFIC
mmetsp:Transcript_18914/g.21496  ORF Transcript_18914/g.21496 Transcript_18914/m.21496 type:complete len:480 (-) Transcript_18914:92-1531(-)